METYLRNLLLLTLASVKGQVSIPTCCRVQDVSNFQFKCSDRTPRAESSRVVPRTIPGDISHRLGLSHLGNDSQWVEKDVKCVRALQLPVLQNLSLGLTPPKFQFQADGYLMVWNDQGSADYLHVDQYCINELTDSSIILKSCEAKCGGAEPCIRLCCPLGTVFLFKQTPPPQCIPKKWHPMLYRNVAKSTTVFPEKELRKLQPRYFYRPYSVWKGDCDNNVTHAIVNTDQLFKAFGGINGPAEFVRFRLDSYGSPRYRNQFRRWVPLVDGQQCIAGIDLPGTKISDPTAAILFVCNDQKNQLMGLETQVSELYGPLAILTSIFALVTVIVYALLFEKQNVHGWTTMSHSTSVFFCFIFLGTSHITKEHNDFHATTGCTIVATATHYFYIANFTWLLMLSLDVWLTFRTVSAPLARGGKGVKRFCLYSLVGWGLPFIVVSISWFLEIKFRQNEESEVPVPMYGDLFCYVARHALWEFVYGPVSILFIINISLFCWTSVTLYKFQQSTKIATQHINQERQSFLLFFKLFLVCGILWMTELLSFVFSGGHINWYIQIFDSVNILQPVAIFVIFIFKWEMINALHEKYIPLRPLIFPARYILIKIRQYQNSHTGPVHYKGNEIHTHVSRVSTLESTSTF